MIISIKNTILSPPTYKGLRFTPGPPSIDHSTEEIDGRGVIITESIVKDRPITVEFSVKGKDYTDAENLKRQTIALLISDKSYPISNNIDKGKRWEVRLRDYDIERISPRVMRFTVNYVCESSLSETIGTTLDPYTLETVNLQTEKGLIKGSPTPIRQADVFNMYNVDDILIDPDEANQAAAEKEEQRAIIETPSYIHRTNKFKIFNAGDVPVNPSKVPLKIKFIGSSSNLRIINRTTGDEWRFNGTSGAKDVIMLDGIRSLKNDVSIFGNTNKKLITINPGWNDFEITGASDFSITFDFRFYYY